MNYFKKQLESNIQYLEKRIAERQAENDANQDFYEEKIKCYRKGLNDGFINCAELEIKEYRLLIRLLESEGNNNVG